jgi:hypothetical protein
MSVLTASRDTREIVGSLLQLTVKAEKTIYAGALVAVDATGYALPAADAANLRVLGRAEHSAAAGEKVVIKRGIFLFDNNSGDAVDAADIGGYCYVADDQTVQATANSNAVVAGLVRGVTADGVYVDTTLNPDGATAGATAGAAAIAADLESAESTIKAAALVQGAAAIAADLESAESTIKAANLNAAGNVRLVEAPAAANSPGVKGDIAIAGGAIYLCTATNTWVKATLLFDSWSD